MSNIIRKKATKNDGSLLVIQSKRETDAAAWLAQLLQAEQWRADLSMSRPIRAESVANLCEAEVQRRESRVTEARG